MDNMYIGVSSQFINEERENVDFYKWYLFEVIQYQSENDF